MLVMWTSFFTVLLATSLGCSCVNDEFEAAAVRLSTHADLSLYVLGAKLQGSTTQDDPFQAGVAQLPTTRHMHPPIACFARQL